MCVCVCFFYVRREKKPDGRHFFMVSRIVYVLSVGGFPTSKRDIILWLFSTESIKLKCHTT